MNNLLIETINKNIVGITATKRHQRVNQNQKVIYQNQIIPTLRSAVRNFCFPVKLLI